MARINHLTVLEHIHAFGVNSALLFRDLQTGEHCAENMAEYKKLQSALEKSLEAVIRRTIADEA